jgi:hypothetical protein
LTVSFYCNCVCSSYLSVPMSSPLRAATIALGPIATILSSVILRVPPLVCPTCPAVNVSVVGPTLHCDCSGAEAVRAAAGFVNDFPTCAADPAVQPQSEPVTPSETCGLENVAWLSLLGLWKLGLSIFCCGVTAGAVCISTTAGFCRRQKKTGAVVAVKDTNHDSTLARHRL